MAGKKKDFLNYTNDFREEEGVRLNKFLGDSGICSRREADRQIAAGAVTVNGVKAEVGIRVYPGDKVVCGGKEIKKDEKLILIAFHKPRGIECTTDRRVPDNVIDYLNYGKRIFPIGRLDKDSEGLLLLTNDGDIVNKILRARNFHEKEYVVTVNKPITPEFLKGMSEGVPILDTVTRPCKVVMEDKFTFRIILTQGLNRQIRRMCEYFGYRVQTLMRVRIMNITLGRLKCGGYRNVTEEELKQLAGLLEDSEKTAPEADTRKTAESPKAGRGTDGSAKKKLRRESRAEGVKRGTNQSLDDNRGKGAASRRKQSERSSEWNKDRKTYKSKKN